jgi:hypothetical protein
MTVFIRGDDKNARLSCHEKVVMAMSDLVAIIIERAMLRAAIARRRFVRQRPKTRKVGCVGAVPVMFCRSPAMHGHAVFFRMFAK